MRKSTVTALCIIALALASCGRTSRGSAFQEYTVESKSTDSDRRIGVYIPDGYSPKNTYPVIYMEDGLVYTSGNYRHLMDSLIDNRIIKPLIMVCSYEDKSPIKGYNIARRNAEYVETIASGDSVLQNIFDNHLNYLINELIPFIEKNYSVSKERDGRTYYGTSNSADFGLTLSMMHPELMHEYWCFSPVFSDMTRYGMLKESTDYQITWGAKEEAGMSFDYFPALMQSIRKRGGNVHSWAFDGGHDRDKWQEEFIKLLAERFAL